MGQPPVIEFSGLYQAHAREVYRFALFLSGDPALADDIVSETFIRLWGARARVDLATVRSYLLTIARNLFLHERRHLRRMEALGDDRRVDGTPAPDARLQAQRELAVVLDALQALPEIDRAAVAMRAVEGMSYEEIAAALGITVAAARVKVHRARLRLAGARRGGAAGAARVEEGQ
jgi:RNA polymerase sigma-70 factor (ECF subfamily)